MAPFVSNPEPSFVLEEVIESAVSNINLLNSKPSSSTPSSSSNVISTLEKEAIRNILAFIQTEKTFQLSSFGPTGLVILDLLNRSNLLSSIPVVFIDTLHHFEETYQLIERVKQAYPKMDLRIYKPKGCQTRQEFENKYGTELWERMPAKYAYYTKVEPRDRALAELGTKSYINGRRKSQGDQRGELSFLDFDSEHGINRVQPLYSWTLDQVWQYIRANHVPYNALHDKGFKSVGDFMTTSATGDGDDERAGRWKGKKQTECGLYLNPSQLALLGQA